MEGYCSLNMHADDCGQELSGTISLDPGLYNVVWYCRTVFFFFSYLNVMCTEWEKKAVIIKATPALTSICSNARYSGQFFLLVTSPYPSAWDTVFVSNVKVSLRTCNFLVSLHYKEKIYLRVSCIYFHHDRAHSICTFRSWIYSYFCCALVW